MLKMVKTSLKGVCGDRYRGHCNAVLQPGKEFGLDSKEEWEFTTKEQSGGH